MPNINLLAKTVGKFLSDNSPKIMTGMAVAGVVSTTVLAVRATPQALDRIAAAEEETIEELRTIEKFKAAWTCYIPAAGVGTVTIACIIAGNQISSKRSAALMSLWTITENGFREYQEKVTEQIGATKEQKVRDDIAQDHVTRTPSENKEIIITGDGEVICYEGMTGRYFKSDMQALRSAVNDVNEKIINDGYATQNEFFRAIGLPVTAMGDELGWNTDHLLDVTYSTTLTDKNVPCLAINYRANPIRGYYTDFLH